MKEEHYQESFSFLTRSTMAPLSCHGQTASSPNVYTIPTGLSFLDILAKGIDARFGVDPLSLTTVTVLLPSHRACRALREAFLRRHDGRAMLLPRILPLDFFESASLTLFDGQLPQGAETTSLLTAIDPLRRHLLLIQQIMRHSIANPMTILHAASVALSLAHLIDEVQIARLTFDKLSVLVPDDYAHHWQVTLKFLSSLVQEWPHILTREKSLDPVDHRVKNIERHLQRWQQHPPTHPLIAAGFIGSDPSVNDLLVTIARLDKGVLILPGVDQESDDLSWNTLWQQQDEQHPQFPLAHLIAALGLSRRTIPLWIEDDCSQHERNRLSERHHLITQTFLPTAITDTWPRRKQGSLSITKEAIKGLVRIECRNQEEEATIISLILRKTLEIPGRTAMLVTPMRPLARRVIARLERWKIRINDSGGHPLTQTQIGSFLRLCAQCAAENCSFLPLLALAKHPLAAGGMKPGRFRDLTRVLEKYIIRRADTMLQPGLDGLRVALNKSNLAPLIDHADLVVWIDQFEDMIKPFTTMITDNPSLPVLVQSHITFAETLATTDQESGQERLWRHNDGQEAAEFIHALYTAGTDLDLFPGSDYPRFFDSLMDQRVVRPHYGLHPRLAIYGPLEARLLHADVTILAALNEETWPAPPSADPWMSRPMRQTFGLPTPEARIGRAAHTVSQLMSSAEVFLIRAQHGEGVPTVPSRWLSRLDAVLQAARFDASLPDIDQTRLWSHWTKCLDEPTKIEKIPVPMPTPPVAVRPRKLSVTQIKTWIQQPYTIYARHILKLRPLDPIVTSPTHAVRGGFIHQALAEFLRLYPHTLPDDALEILLNCGKEQGKHLKHTDQWAFWWPWFEQMADYFLLQEKEYRSKTRQHLGIELRGSMIFQGKAGPFTITGRADRIDRLPDGRVMIVDYKTGKIPSGKEVKNVQDPQLPLLALIAKAGGFPGVNSTDPLSMCYWQLSAKQNVKLTEIEEDLHKIVEILKHTNDAIEQLICAFDKQEIPYCAHLPPRSSREAGTYDHLARVKEWSTTGQDEEEE